MDRTDSQSRGTIIALATPPGRSALAIVRLSGSGVSAILTRLFRTKSGGPIRPRYAHLGDWLDLKGQAVDQSILIFYPASSSPTGEDLAELILHGSMTIVREAIAACRAAGAVPAQPGEFARRALEHGKIDLSQAEALSDLIDAATPAQARVALRQVQGEVGASLSPLAEELFDLLSDIEASLDFNDGETDLGLAGRDVAQRTAMLAKRLERLLEASAIARRIHEGARCVLSGPPNAGKSSLFNALLGSERAIVSAEPGTTRDLLIETIEVEGLPVVLIDAAGIGIAEGPALREAMRRAGAARDSADLVLSVYDLSIPTRPAIDDSKNILYVGTHADLTLAAPPIPGSISVDAIRGVGLEELRRAIGERLHAPGGRAPESAALVNERQRAAAERALGQLHEAAAHAAEGAALELLAIELRTALAMLEEILGKVGPEELLGRIFGRFCVGK